MKFNVVPFNAFDVFAPHAAKNRALVGACVNALLEPYGLSPPDYGNHLRGCRVLDVAAAMCEQAGVPNSEEAARRMLRINAQAFFSTSDFPSVLAGVIQQALLAGWESGPHTYERFCGFVDVRSYRPEQRVVVGGLGLLSKTQENGEIRAGEIPGYAMKVSADAYGAGFGITSQALIDNDLSKVISVAKTIGRAAAATLDSAVFGILNANTTMVDGGATFNTTSTDTAGGHANLAASGSSLSSTSVAAGKAVMRRQKAPDGDRPLNIRPRYLLVPAELEEAAWDTVGLPQGFGESGSDVERYLIEAGRVEPISTPFLSGTPWYLAASPDVAPLINIALLHGQATPTLASKYNFRSAGVDFIARFDFGAAPADWRGGYSDPGV
jgi:hypothetical protein